jgi:hypothetical protein
MAGDEDDRKADVRFYQCAMEIEAVKAWEPDIQDDAARSIRPLESQKLFGCAERLYVELDRPDKTFQCFPDGSIIIDDKDHRLTHCTPLRLNQRH